MLTSGWVFVGRCSHICNAGFLTCAAARGKGIGSVMGETYLVYAPKLVCYPVPPFLLFLSLLLSSPPLDPAAKVSGIQILRLQPRIRQQSGIEQDMGSARIPGSGPSAGSGQIGE